MEPMSRTERAALCNSALEAGEEAPTLCGAGPSRTSSSTCSSASATRWPRRDPGPAAREADRAVGAPAGRPGLHRPGRAGAQRPADVVADGAAAARPGGEHAGVLRPPRGHPPRRPGWQPRELTDREQRTLWKVVGHGRQGPGPAGRRTRRDPLADGDARARRPCCARATTRRSSAASRPSWRCSSSGATSTPGCPSTARASTWTRSLPRDLGL